MCSRNYQKKGTTVFEGGGGGGRVRVCQVNVTRITRQVFEILNFVFGNLSFVFRSPYSTVCSHILVVVANIQMRALKTEVEKGSM